MKDKVFGSFEGVQEGAEVGTFSKSSPLGRFGSRVEVGTLEKQKETSLVEGESVGFSERGERATNTAEERR